MLIEDRTLEVVAFAACVLPARVAQLVAVFAPRRWPLLFAGRALNGFGRGLIAVVAPVYISEIGPKELRGTVAIFQALGVCLAGVSGAGLGMDIFLGRWERWSYFYALLVIAAAVVLPFLGWLPDSPANAIAGDDELLPKAVKALTFFKGRPPTEEEMGAVLADAAILRQSKASSDRQILSCFKILTCVEVRMQLKLALAVSAMYFPTTLVDYASRMVEKKVMIGSVLTAYSTMMMSRAGVGEGTAEKVTLLLKASTFLTFLICLALADRVSRRKQFLFGGTLMTIALILLSALEWLKLPALFICTVFLLQLGLNIGVRPLYYVIVPELFPNRFRVSAKALCNTAVNVISLTAVASLVHIFTAIGPLAYTVMAAPCMASVLYCYIYLRDTTTKEMAQIYQEFQPIVKGNHPK